MFDYIKKLTNPRNLSNFIRFTFMIKNPLIIPLAVFYPKVRMITFSYCNKKVKLFYRNIYDLAIVFEIFVTGVYKVSHISDSKIFADVGGHAGYTAVWVAVLNSSIVVHSFEPDVESQELFLKNIRINNFQDRVFLKKYGLGSKNESLMFYKYENNADNSTIHHEGHTPIQEYTIEIKDSATILSNLTPDFLKVDIEGFEDEVIYSYLKTGNRPKYMAVEFSNNKERDLLQAIKSWEVFTKKEYENSIEDIIVHSTLR